MRLTHWQINLDDAKAFVGQEHRHHPPPVAAKWSLGAFVNGQLVGVAMVGRCVSRMLDVPRRAEVIRLATDGTPNACSYLYRAASRTAQSMGYWSLKTYTLETESGASLRGCGAKDEGVNDGGSWSVPSRPRLDKHPLGRKRRWELLHETAHLVGPRVDAPESATDDALELFA